MSTKVAVVTESYNGIGFAIVRGLCKKFDGVVYLTSRDVERGQRAVSVLNKEGLTPNFYQLDITDKKSLENFRNDIKSHYGGIDVLFINPGLTSASSASDSTSMQPEPSFFPDYFCLVSVSEVLFPIVRNGGRVINIKGSSGEMFYFPELDLSHNFGNRTLTVYELSDIMQQYVEAAKQRTDAPGESDISTYTVARKGVTTLTKIQQRMLHERGIKVNAIHPLEEDGELLSHEDPVPTETGVSLPLFLALEAPDSVKAQYIMYDNRVD